VKGSGSQETSLAFEFWGVPPGGFSWRNRAWACINSRNKQREVVRTNKRTKRQTNQGTTQQRTTEITGQRNKWYDMKWHSIRWNQIERMKTHQIK
jgi:hypothetical protein